MRMIFVKPVNAKVPVRHPEKRNHVLAADGEWVMRSNQWLRYIADGDVIEVEQPELNKPDVPAKKAAKRAEVAEKEVEQPLDGDK